MAHHEHPSPLARFGQLLQRERGEIWVLLTYTVAVVLFGLLIPLATQSLVNTIAGGLFLQPLVVLALLVFGALFLGGVMQLLQLSVVESVQQRIFAVTSLRIADVLARACAKSLRNEYTPELVNRFFDILTVQKALSKLLVDGLTAITQTVLGLAILGFYNTNLLLLDLLLIVGLLVTTVVFGSGGLKTSIKESKEKYHVADWLEDIARCNVSLKVHGARDYLEHRADQAVSRYLLNRRDHFRITLRQKGAFYFFQAVTQAGALAGGGVQVISGNITLGQLVAAQIIIGTVLVAMEKLVRQTDQFFDLLTGLDKVGHVADLVTERTGGNELKRPADAVGLDVICRNIRFSYVDNMPVLSGLDMHLKAGERVSLVGASGAGKSTLGALLCGLDDPTHGTIEFDGAEIRTLSLDSIREHVSMIGYENELFDGTIEENIVLGRKTVSPQDVRWAIEMAQLTEDIALMPKGLATQIISGGKNLSRGQIQRLLIARAIVGHPRLLILDEAFTGIDERQTLMILDAIFDPINTWTIIDISHDSEVIIRTETVYVLTNGDITETGRLQSLAKDGDSQFSQLFPVLSRQIRGGFTPW
jgi:ABC-type bacteriocin/lantibiotic exporter with double-glycine peptidase domain